MASRPRKARTDNWDVRGAPHEILHQEAHQNPLSFHIIQGSYNPQAAQRWQFDQAQPMQACPPGGTYRDISQGMSSSYPPSSIAAPFTMPYISSNVNVGHGLDSAQPQSADQRYVGNSRLNTLFEMSHATQGYASANDTGHRSNAPYAPTIQDFNNQHNLMHNSTYSQGVSSGAYASGMSTELVSANNSSAAPISNLDMVSVGQGWASEN